MVALKVNFYHMKTISIISIFVVWIKNSYAILEKKTVA